MQVIHNDVTAKLAEATVTEFGISQWPSMYYLVREESNFNPWAVNKSSGAGGLGQALPPSKMGCKSLDDVQCQINWLIGYVKQRYGTPEKAWQFHLVANYY